MCIEFYPAVTEHLFGDVLPLSWSPFLLVCAITVVLFALFASAVFAIIKHLDLSMANGPHAAEQNSQSNSNSNDDENNSQANSSTFNEPIGRNNYRSSMRQQQVPAGANQPATNSKLLLRPIASSNSIHSASGCSSSNSPCKQLGSHNIVAANNNTFASSGGNHYSVLPPANAAQTIYASSLNSYSSSVSTTNRSPMLQQQAGTGSGRPQQPIVDDSYVRLDLVSEPVCEVMSADHHLVSNHLLVDGSSENAIGRTAAAQFIQCGADPIGEVLNWRQTGAGTLPKANLAHLVTSDLHNNDKGKHLQGYAAQTYLSHLPLVYHPIWILLTH